MHVCVCVRVRVRVYLLIYLSNLLLLIPPENIAICEVKKDVITAELSFIGTLNSLIET